MMIRRGGVEHHMEYHKQFADRLVNYEKADREGKSAA
jgi:hypothetical protein